MHIKRERRAKFPYGWDTEQFQDSFCSSYSRISFFYWILLVALEKCIKNTLAEACPFSSVDAKRTI